MRILGIDPGIAIVGYSVIDTDGDNYNLVSSGSIRTDKNKPEAARLVEIANDLEEIIKTYNPDSAGVEKLYFFKNQKTIIPVAQARGVIMMTLEKYSVDTEEYTPIVVKQTISGYGRATKDEVAVAVKQMVCQKTGCCFPKLDDTIDSIAVAVCHARNVGCCFAKYAQV
jgi:crossover junction endodeoxyribonuclease RuvC